MEQSSSKSKPETLPDITLMAKLVYGKLLELRLPQDLKSIEAMNLARSVVSLFQVNKNTVEAA